MLVAAGLFLFFALIYFLPISIPHKIFVPLLVLTVFSFGRLPLPMCLAFLFSCIGDLAGSFVPSYGNIAFICQMGGFGIAHIFFIIFFLSWGLKQKREHASAEKSAAKAAKKAAKKGRAVAVAAASAEKPVQQKGLYMAMVLALTMIVVYQALTRVVPCVPEGVLRTGVTSYVVVIAVMMWSALMNGDWIWGLAAVLFVTSDFILAWNRFVSPLPAETLLIMIPYYAAQLILFLRTAENCQ